MQTLPANNPDGKGPYNEQAAKPAEGDANPHEPRKSVIRTGDDSEAVEAAEGEIKHTPQGP